LLHCLLQRPAPAHIQLNIIVIGCIGRSEGASFVEGPVGQQVEGTAACLAEQLASSWLWSVEGGNVCRNSSSNSSLSGATGSGGRCNQHVTCRSDGWGLQALHMLCYVMMMLEILHDRDGIKNTNTSNTSMLMSRRPCSTTARECWQETTLLCCVWMSRLAFY
jgi:hypothetical protein